MMEVIKNDSKTESLKSPVQDEFFDAEDKEGKQNFHMKFADELYYFLSLYMFASFYSLKIFGTKNIPYVQTL